MRTLTRKSTALALAAALILLSQPIAAAPVRVGNVMPLHNQAGENFCTAFQINERDGLWASAGHCVAAAMRHGKGMFIAGKEAILIEIGFDEHRDYAILEVHGIRATRLKLAPLAPRQGDRATIAGYPYGWPVLTVTSGHIAARLVTLGPVPVSDVYDITIAGGNSGSPVLNARGEVIGLLWGGMNEAMHGLGIPWEALKRDAGKYFQK